MFEYSFNSVTSVNTLWRVLLKAQTFVQQQKNISNQRKNLNRRLMWLKGTSNLFWKMAKNNKCKIDLYSNTRGYIKDQSEKGVI